jgi:CobQ-like glutamine amidotransferase family enzyme
MVLGERPLRKEKDMFRKTTTAVAFMMITAAHAENCPSLDLCEAAQTIGQFMRTHRAKLEGQGMTEGVTVDGPKVIIRSIYDITKADVLAKSSEVGNFLQPMQVGICETLGDFIRAGGQIEFTGESVDGFVFADSTIAKCPN